MLLGMRPPFGRGRSPLICYWKRNDAAGRRPRPVTFDEVRRAALAKSGQRYQEPEPPTVTFERELADGALAHARYLQQNKEQLAAWPDAHEEWPDRPGFSAAGSIPRCWQRNRSQPRLKFLA